MQFWTSLSAAAIPSKAHLHPSFTSILQSIGNVSSRSLLDLGCGSGAISHYLARTYGLAVTGADCNAEAIAKAREQHQHTKDSSGSLSFLVGDATSVDLTKTHPLFDVVMLQLVISIIGDRDARKKLLGNARRHVKTGGVLLLSASGASEDINPNYRVLYEKDEKETGEKHTYFSRDEKTGAVMYVTHHFETDELAELLRESGFCVKQMAKEKEVSSRRKDQAAYFLYCVCEAV